MPLTARSFNEILFAILTDRRNLAGGVDVEVLIQKLRDYQAEYGEVPDISAETLISDSVLASLVWGLEKRAEHISKQPFPDTADEENLNHHGVVENIPRNAGESLADYAIRILTDIQNPAAGGNQYDLKKWAEEVYGVDKAYPKPLAQGDGTCDVVIVASASITGSDIPSNSVMAGKVDAVAVGYLKDADVDFSAVRIGTVVRNTFSGAAATVVSRAMGQMGLSDDIFKYVGQHYHVHRHSGVVDAVAVNKLKDSGGAFLSATYTMKKGDVVKNISEGTETHAASVDENGIATIDADIFKLVGQAYIVESVVGRVKEYLDSKAEVDSSAIRVVDSPTQSQDVNMGVVGDVDAAQIKADIEAMMNKYIPDQVFYPAQCVTLAIVRGGKDATVSVPAAKVTPDTYKRIRPGTVTVLKVSE